MDPKVKQKTLQLITNGMYVLTSRDGDKFGAATITWVSQASFKPPLLMAALRKDGSVFDCLAASRAAVLHILTDQQKDIAQKFFAATRKSGETLNGEPFVAGKTSAPILKNLGPYLECKLVHICEEHGDHAVVILEVIEAGGNTAMNPLVVRDSPWKYGG